MIPLADAVTLPDCSLPAGVIVVSAFHGGLLGDAAVLPMVSRFLSGQPVSQGDPGMRQAAEMITGASAAWRLPDTRSLVPPENPVPPSNHWFRQHPRGCYCCSR